MKTQNGRKVKEGADDNNNRSAYGEYQKSVIVAELAAAQESQKRSELKKTMWLVSTCRKVSRTSPAAQRPLSHSSNSSSMAI